MNTKLILLSASLLAVLSACNQNGQNPRRNPSLKAAAAQGEKTVQKDVMDSTFQALEASYKSTDLSISSQIQAISISREQVNSTNPTGGINAASPKGGLTVNVLFDGTPTPVVLATAADTSTWQNGQVYDLTIGTDASIKAILNPSGSNAPHVRAVCLTGSAGVCEHLGILVSVLDNSTSTAGGISSINENAGFIFDGTRLERGQGSVKDLNTQQVNTNVATK